MNRLASLALLALSACATAAPPDPQACTAWLSPSREREIQAWVETQMTGARQDFVLPAVRCESAAVMEEIHAAGATAEDPRVPIGKYLRYDYRLSDGRVLKAGTALVNADALLRTDKPATEELEPILAHEQCHHVQERMGWSSKQSECYALQARWAGR